MARQFVDSHFDWDISSDPTVKDVDDIIGKLDIDLTENCGSMEIETVLLKAFLYVSPLMRPRDKDLQMALRCLEDAYRKIQQCDVDDAKSGYAIVCHTLQFHIQKDILHNDKKAEAYRKKIETIEKTEAVEGYIHATHAFALSYLGPNRNADCLAYYEKATTIDGTNPEWLLGLAIHYRRAYRFSKDQQELMNKSVELHQQVLRENPKHVLALLFLAEHNFESNQASEANEKYEAALKIAEEQGGHSVVYRRVATFRRRNRGFSRDVIAAKSAKSRCSQRPCWISQNMA